MNKKANNFFLFFIIFYIVVVMGFSVIFTWIKAPMWLLSIIPELVILIPSFIYIKMNKIDIFNALPVKHTKISQVLISLIVGLLTVPTANLISIITMFFTTNYVSQTSSQLLQYPIIVDLIIVAVIPALFEEFVFRGLFYHSYRKNGIPAALLMSALAFGCFHLNFNQFAYAFVIGIVFAFIVEATGSIFTSMAAHFAVNSYSVIMIFVAKLVSNDSSQVISDAAALTQITPVYIVVLGLFAAFNLTIVFFIVRAMSIRNNRWNYLTGQLRKGFIPQNGEKTWSWTAIVATAICFIVMFIVR